jgi:exonuclease I
VRATIALARLIRQHQPKLFDFCFALHKKDRVADEIGMHLAPQLRQPFLHVSACSRPNAAASRWSTRWARIRPTRTK